MIFVLVLWFEFKGTQNQLIHTDMEKFQEQRDDDHDQVYEAEEPEPR